MARTMLNDLNSHKSFWTEASHKETLLGYPNVSKAYIVYNSRTLTIEESICVKFNDSKLNKLTALSEKSHLNRDPKSDKF
ncbi:hypothetical protein CR513_18553, partial [Mucuna pruriens]